MNGFGSPDIMGIFLGQGLLPKAHPTIVRHYAEVMTGAGADKIIIAGTIGAANPASVRGQC